MLLLAVSGGMVIATPVSFFTFVTKIEQIINTRVFFFFSGFFLRYLFCFLLLELLTRLREEKIKSGYLALVNNIFFKAASKT